MTTVHSQAHNDDIAREGNRVLTFYGILLSNLGSFGIMFFWLTGAIHLWQRSGGQINMMELEGLSLILFWALPFVVIASLASWLLYLARLDLFALAVAAAPIGLTVVYYLWLVIARVA